MTNVIKMFRDPEECLLGLISLASEWLIEFGNIPVALLKPDGTIIHHNVGRFEVVEDEQGHIYFALRERILK